MSRPQILLPTQSILTLDYKLASRWFPRYVNMVCITMNVDINYPDSLLSSKSTDNFKITIHNEGLL